MPPRFSIKTDFNIRCECSTSSLLDSLPEKSGRTTKSQKKVEHDKMVVFLVCHHSYLQSSPPYLSFLLIFFSSHFVGALLFWISNLLLGLWIFIILFFDQIFLGNLLHHFASYLELSRVQWCFAILLCAKNGVS